MYPAIQFLPFNFIFLAFLLNHILCHLLFTPFFLTSTTLTFPILPVPYVFLRLLFHGTWYPSACRLFFRFFHSCHAHRRIFAYISGHLFLPFNMIFSFPLNNFHLLAFLNFLSYFPSHRFRFVCLLFQHFPFIVLPSTELNLLSHVVYISASSSITFTHLFCSLHFPVHFFYLCSSTQRNCPLTFHISFSDCLFPRFHTISFFSHPCDTFYCSYT